MVKGTAGPGVYSATYSNIPVYEFQFGPDLKEHVMRRRHDDWINATHILKAAGFDKPARTRILEREVQKELHEKVQGGYGKYQGTWVPLDHGEALAQRNGVYDKLRTIFEFKPGHDSPPPAPKHTTNKPKVAKKPAVPKWNMGAPSRVREESFDNISSQLNDDETPDDMTVASASYMGEDDNYPMSQQSTGHRKRKADQISAPNMIEQTHMIYSDELLDYFMLSQADEPTQRPEPPPNFQPDWIIDSDGHTAMHWACAMGDTEVMKQLKRFGASTTCENCRGETPLMRAVLFTNCSDKQSMPLVVKELIDTINCQDLFGSTAIHHAATLTASRSKHQVARYYLDVILNKMQELWDQEEVQRLLDARDANGNTACHIAAKGKARKCVRALIGRGASTDIPNNEGVLAEDLIQQLNSKPRDQYPNASSSPFAPDSHRHMPQQGPAASTSLSRHTTSHHSEAAMSVESKVTPLILEKFQGLAQAFDEELVDRDNSEKEAKRILNTTLLELATVREQIMDLGAAEEPDHVDDKQQAQLVQAERAIMSVVEQQQQIRLNALVQQEEGMTNGSSVFESGDDKSEEKIKIITRFISEQKKRSELVQEYADALSLAGMGEKGEMYRKLIVKCLNIKEDEVDENLDSLISVLEEDKVDTNGGEMLLAEDM